MLDTDDLRNIKDLLESTVLASEARTNEKLKKIEKKFDERFDEIENKIDDLAGDVGAAISLSNDETSSKLKNHETRIKKLELKAA
jgi:di/tripeptidase